MRINYVIVFVSDMKRGIQFYRDTLGLPLKFESPEWTEFATEGATLALHAAIGSGAGGGIAPQATEGICQSGFDVPDLEDFHRRMVEQDVTCLQEPRAVFGFRVAKYADPDGLEFSVGESK